MKPSVGLERREREREGKREEGGEREGEEEGERKGLRGKAQLGDYIERRGN